MSQTVTSSESMDYESFKGDSPLKTGRQSTESFKSAGVIPAAPSNGSSLARSSSLRISRKKGTLASGQRDMRNLGKYIFLVNLVKTHELWLPKRDILRAHVTTVVTAYLSVCPLWAVQMDNF